MNKLPFPKIDPYVFDREGLKECYVFKPKNPDVEKDCPTIIHFVLANINFRKYKAPGILAIIIYSLKQKTEIWQENKTAIKLILSCFTMALFYQLFQC